MMTGSLCRVVTLMVASLVSTVVCLAQERLLATVASPDATLKVELLENGTERYYRAYRNDVQVVADSRLGMTFSQMPLSALSFEKQEVEEIDETYALPSGKVSEYHNRCNQLTAVFTASLGRRFSVVFRVYDEGFAFRYEVGGVTSPGSFVEELSEVVVKDYSISWSQKYHKAYETTYDPRSWLAVSDLPDGVGTPALVRTKSSDYLLVTEAANTGVYATSKLMPQEECGRYKFQPVGTVKLSYPFVSPWRVVLAGDLKDMVESVMVENLNDDADSDDWAWVKPGRAAWNWGGEDAEDVISYDIALAYVDLAERMGWEYFVLDAGWSDLSEKWLGSFDAQNIIEYAAKKGVGIILWVHHNWFTKDESQIRNILSEWKNWGAKGVKIDFWEDDSQDMMQKYDAFLKVAAEQRLVVDLHGCTRPSGLHRKWPHLLTSEAVWGGELYLGNRVKLAAWHNVMLALTRNVVGSMDYTPGEFATKWGAVAQLTSWSHQVALLTLYESGIQCYVDHPDNYRYHVAESFLKEIPASWDEVRLLEAEPEEFVTMARRKGEDWFVASIANKVRTLSFTPAILEKGKQYKAYVYKDGACRAEIAFEYRPDVTDETLFEVPVLAEGGVTVLFTQRDLPKPYQLSIEAESARTFASKTNDADGLCSGGKYVSSLGNGTMKKLPLTVDVEAEGEYALTVFYMTDTERDAYISVNGGDKLYHAFPATGGLSGRFMHMKTVLVELDKGTNTLEMGNETAPAPNIDRITLKKVVDPIEPTAVRSFAKNEKKAVEVRAEGRNIHVYVADGGAVCTLYSTDGCKLHGWTAGEGETVETPDVPESGGVYIVNVNTGKESYSTKLVIR